MRKVFASLVLVLVCVMSAFATDITISTHQVSGYAYSDAAPKIRVYVSQGFLSADGVWIPGSAVGSANWYRTISCTANTTTDVLTIPSFSLPPTVNGNPSTSRYTLVLYTGTTKRETLYSNLRMPTVYGTTITIGQWITDNQVAPTTPRPGFPDTQQVQTLINAVLPAPKATTTVEGIGKVSVTPEDPLHPKFVGDNDPRLAVAATSVFNVKVYGAVCDGVTDDTVAVTAAKNAAEANGNNSTLYFPGLCLMRKTSAGGEVLLLRKALILQGTGKDTSGILASTDTPNTVDVVRYNPLTWPDTKGFTIRDMTIGSAGRCEGNTPPYETGCAEDGGEWFQGPNISARYALVFDSIGASERHPIQGVLVENSLLGPTAVGAVYGTTSVAAGTPTTTVFLSNEIFGPVKWDGAGDSITFIGGKQYGPGYAHEVTQILSATKYSIIAPNITNDGGLIYHKAVSPEIYGGIIEIYKSWRSPEAYGGANGAIIDFAGDAIGATVYQPLVAGTVVNSLGTSNLDGIRFGTTQFGIVRGVHFLTPSGKSGLVNSATAANSIWERNQQFGAGERWSDPGNRLQLHVAGFAYDQGISTDLIANLGLIGNARFSAPNTSSPARLQLNFTDSAQTGEVEFNINGANASRIRMMGSTSARPNDLEFVNSTSVGQLSWWSNNTRRWILGSAGHLTTLADNAYDIGASGATRPRTGYFGTSVIAPFYNFGASAVIVSAATIAPTGSIRHVSGTAAIDTITIPAACTPTCQITLIPDGVFTTTTAGNIALASTAVVGRALIMTWDGTKWSPSY